MNREGEPCGVPSTSASDHPGRLRVLRHLVARRSVWPVTFEKMFGFDRDDSGPDPLSQPQRPTWFGPPDQELGVTVPVDRIVARSESGVVALSNAVVYSTGIVFDFAARARGLSRSQANRLFHEQHLSGDAELPDSLLRIGFEFADGRRASNLGGLRAHGQIMTPDAEPTEPVLMPTGGGGSETGTGLVSLRPAYWLWPLPPSGPLQIASEWPIVAIPLTTMEVDGGKLVEAARRPIDLWSPLGS
jgi:hypothetical protein